MWSDRRCFNPSVGLKMGPGSIVVPLRNEAENVEPLVREVQGVLSSFAAGVQIVLVDDHSSDGTAVELRRVAAMHPEVRVVTLRDGSGKDCALVTGLRRASGDWVVTMDGDLQNDPGDIPRLLAGLQSCDMVCGVRTRRKQGLLRRSASWIANTFRNAVTGDSIEDAGCALRAMCVGAAQYIVTLNPQLFGTAHCFYPTILRRRGFRIGQLSVRDRPRSHGSSKFGIVRGRLVTGLRACLKVRSRYCRGRTVSNKSIQRMPVNTGARLEAPDPSDVVHGIGAAGRKSQ